MVIDTTRLLFRFIISALSATACIFPNRETVGEPVEPLPAGLPDCCLRACRTTVTSTGQRPVEVLVTMVMLWSTKAPLRASWDP